MPIELFDPPTLDRRRYCECCRYPTLFVPDWVDGTPEWDNAATACDLCEWESAPLGRTGEPRTDVVDERNDGLSLEVARRNLERGGSIHDPGNLPAWKIASPSVAVQHAREVLRTAYQDLMEVPAEERWGPWSRVMDAEASLRDALQAQQQDAERAVDDIGG